MHHRWEQLAPGACLESPLCSACARRRPQAFQGGNGEEMSSEQLELLREYLRAQEEQEALLQAQVESLKREVGAGHRLLGAACAAGCWANCA